MDKGSGVIKSTAGIVDTRITYARSAPPKYPEEYLTWGLERLIEHIEETDKKYNKHNRAGVAAMR